ncbi:M48 family metalloprotease [Haloarcula marina]|uniref:M48 family metalloprotease n=1 Tax=Haloarcula marina TaxID=2961574 RepID=UPI0020B80246|nr:M48 family metalloprotease [Halomicroarcula marina]
MGTLTRRILFTLSLLLAVDLAVVLTVAALLTPWLAPLRAALARVLPVGSAIAWWVAVVAPSLLAFVWAQLRYTRRQTLAAVDASVVGPEAYPALHDRVQRLCQQADMSVPTLAVAESSVPNSFAVGTFGSATVVVSEGLLSTLDGAALDAVLAHELMHVKNRDATVMTLASFLPALTNGEYGPLDDLLPGFPGRRVVVGVVGLAVAAVLSVRFVDAPVGSLEFALAVSFLFAATVGLGGVLLGVFTAPVVVLARSLSRAREFAADRSAARLTGNPSALVEALERLDDGAAATPERDKRRAYDGVRGLCFLPHGFERSPPDETFHVETRSHPPTDERIARLRRVEIEL